MDDSASPLDAVTENPGPFIGITGTLCCLAFAVSSLASIPPLHYGIRYNFFSKYADVDEVYGPGRHILGPWNKFLLFPSTAQALEFSNGLNLQQYGVRYPALHTRTKDGLSLHLAASMQYKLPRRDVGKLYKEFSMDYHNFLVSQIRNILTIVAADYVGVDFWLKRNELGIQMEFEVNRTLSETYAEVWGLQILDIGLPQEFDEAIVETQVRKQKIATQRNMQKAAQVRAETTVIQAEYQRQVKVITAGGQANYTFLTKKASAEAKNRTIVTEAVVAGVIKEKLKFEAQGLLEFQEYLALLAMTNASVLYGFSSDSGVLLETKPSAGAQAAPDARRLEEEVVLPPLLEVSPQVAPKHFGRSLEL